MKKLIAIAVLALAGFTSTAQTTNAPAQPTFLLPANTPVLSILTNIPTVSLQAEQFGVQVATVMQGTTTFENSISFEYVIHTNFAVMAEIQNGGAGSSVVNSAGVFLKVRKAWSQYEVYGDMGGRRNWATGHWEGVAGIGAAYSPTPHLSCFVEQRLIATSAKNAPATETLMGIKLPF